MHTDIETERFYWHTYISHFSQRISTPYVVVRLWKGKTITRIFMVLYPWFFINKCNNCNIYTPSSGTPICWVVPLCRVCDVITCWLCNILKCKIHLKPIKVPPQVMEWKIQGFHEYIYGVLSASRYHSIVMNRTLSNNINLEICYCRIAILISWGRPLTTTI